VQCSGPEIIHDDADGDELLSYRKLGCQFADHTAGDFDRSGSFHTPGPVILLEVISHPNAYREISLLLGNARIKAGELTAEGKIHAMAIAPPTPDREPVGIYKREHGVLRRLAFRKSTTIAAIIRQLIKGV
jgi:hypothetical protein